MPQRRVKAYIYDVLKAAQLLADFTQGATFEDYESNALLRSAVERQFVIIGEALSQLSKIAPEVAVGIRECRRIIAFRNILVHGYAVVDHRVVWGVLRSDLPVLERQVAALLDK